MPARSTIGTGPSRGTSEGERTVKKKLAFLLALMMLVMIPLSYGQAVTVKGFEEKVKKVLEEELSKQKLQFVDGARGSWQTLSGDKMKARFTVTNPSAATKTVKAFELYLYATDVWGERIYGEKTIYYWTTKKNVAPGKSVYSDYCTIPDRSEVDKLYVGVKRCVYTDGTVVEYDDWDVEYSSWTITWD